jgi:hypothetical protein
MQLSGGSETSEGPTKYNGRAKDALPSTRKASHGWVSLLLCFLLVACDSFDTKFVMINNTESTKSFYFSEDSTTNSATKFYSKLFYATPKNGNIPKEFNFLKPYSKRDIGMLGAWEDHLNEQFVDSTAYVYVIDSSDIGKKPEIMVRNNLVSKYRVTSKYMIENNWELIIN